MFDETQMEKADEYHAHLDACEQCREHPFNQCPVGQRLLMAFGDSVRVPENGTLTLLSGGAAIK